MDDPAPGSVGEQAGGRQARLEVFATKAAAEAAGRKTAKRERVEHITQTRDGQVGARNSYGNDPRRFKG